MPQAVSRKQYRMMMAILHGSVKDGPRGRPPKSVAAKYTSPDKEAPESKHNDRGGTWGEEHHKRAKDKVKTARKERKKSKKELKKAFEDFYKSKKWAATLVLDNNGRILLGEHEDHGFAYPGGHLEPNESFEDGALRELHEEAGVIGRITDEIYRDKIDEKEGVVYLAEIANGKLINSHEMSNFKWYEAQEIPWDKLRPCCVKPLKQFVTTKLGKSLKGMMALETLEKNIIRQKADAVLEVTHGDALRLVGTGMFRLLHDAVADMQDEDFKDIHVDTYVISIRKHMNDIYSGRVNDGHKMVYQFTNKSLPELTAGLMSVFEWYLPDDEKALDIVNDQNLGDDIIQGGLHQLIDNYKRHNIGNIYQEMETIREQLRNGVAVDLQQVESRIMSLFDKLENVMHDLSGKHNTLAENVGKDIDELEQKLRELQSKIKDVDEVPQRVEAFSVNPANKDKVHDEYYAYLTKPKVEIEPNGRIVISFGSDWQDMEKVNFLQDMRARVIKPKDKK